MNAEKWIRLMSELALELERSTEYVFKSAFLSACQLSFGEGKDIQDFLEVFEREHDLTFESMSKKDLKRLTDLMNIEVSLSELNKAKIRLAKRFTHDFIARSSFTKGIYLGGSLAYGHPYKFSDIDIIAVIFYVPRKFYVKLSKDRNIISSNAFSDDMYEFVELAGEIPYFLWVDDLGPAAQTCFNLDERGRECVRKLYEAIGIKNEKIIDPLKLMCKAYRVDKLMPLYEKNFSLKLYLKEQDLI